MARGIPFSVRIGEHGAVMRRGDVGHVGGRGRYALVRGIVGITRRVGFLQKSGGAVVEQALHWSPKRRLVGTVPSPYVRKVFYNLPDSFALKI